MTNTMLITKTQLNGLRPYDIICGRGPEAFNNFGNRRCRIFIAMNLHPYLKSQRCI
jgi:hypothetical protein